MADRNEAINCIQDLIDVANNRGSAYVYKHNGGVERLENVMACLKEEQLPIIQAQHVTFGAAEGRFCATFVEPTADEMFREQGYEKITYNGHVSYDSMVSGDVVAVEDGQVTFTDVEGTFAFYEEASVVKAIARLIEEMEAENGKAD